MKHSEDIRMMRFGEDLKGINYNNMDINTKTTINNFLRRAAKRAKKSYCLYCKKNVNSFCNSHSIPKFILKQISSNGYLYKSNILHKSSISKTNSGVNNAGTFHTICRECDSKIFSEYENPKNYTAIPSDKILSQIVIKNSLKMISKRENEISLNEILSEEYPEKDFSREQKIKHLDLEDYHNSYNKAVVINQNNLINNYSIIIHISLDYIVPYAFQGCVTLYSDIIGIKVNDLYNLSDEYKTEEIHLCIFPMDNKTVVIAFVDKDIIRYKRFDRQLKRLDYNDQLSVLNYIIFSYSEDIFISKNIGNEVLNNHYLMEASSMSGIIRTSEPYTDLNAVANSEYDLIKRHRVPNLLLKEYALNLSK